MNLPEPVDGVRDKVAVPFLLQPNVYFLAGWLEHCVALSSQTVVDVQYRFLCFIVAGVVDLQLGILDPGALDQHLDLLRYVDHLLALEL